MSTTAINNLIREALRATGDAGPDASMLSRARKTWLHQILQDVQGRASLRSRGFLKSLHVEAISIAETYRSRYELPADYDQDLQIEILDGTTTGSAQSGDATTVTLASGESITAADAQGRFILMTSGTSKGQYRQIITYNATTKVATVDTTFDTGKSPAPSDGYMVVGHQDTYEMAREVPEKLQRIDTSGRPTHFSEFEGHVIFDRPFDSAMGIRMLYYSDGISLDFDDDVWTRIIRRWKPVLDLGVRTRALMERDDDQYEDTRIDYEAAIATLVTRERDGGEESSRIGVRQ